MLTDKPTNCDKMGQGKMADMFLFRPGALLFLSFYMRSLLLPPEHFTQVYRPSSTDQTAVTGSFVRCTVIAADLYRVRLIFTWARPRPSRMTDSPPFRPSSSPSRSATLVAALLLLAGDVTANPGPAAAVRSSGSISDQLTVRSKIGILNCRSAINKAALIHDLISDRQLDALFLSETWFNVDTPSAILDDVAPPHYAVLHVPRPRVPDGPSRGGGLAVVYRQSTVIRRHPLADKYRPRRSRCSLFESGYRRPAAHPCRHPYLPAAVDVYRARVYY